MKSVAQLRSEGFKVRVHHLRAGFDENGDVVLASKRVLSNDRLIHNGGKTSVEVTTPSGQTLSGVSECSNKDSFCRKTGLAIALGRALKQLEE